MSVESIVRQGISLEEVSLTFGSGDNAVVALDRVDLSVAPGELLAVVGPSGSGKSTLLAVAGGLARPDTGRVRVHGTEISTLSGRQLARFRRTHIGFVFQTGNLIPALTARDQVRLLDRTGGRKRGAARDPGELLAAVGMEAKAGRRPHELSGGERQRVGIARALATDPSLLLVDEPTAALDRARSHEVIELLARQTRERKVATIMVTHDHDILGHCDRVLTLVDGRLSE
ncbi:ABC transporter ATP-binding protein [Nocardia aurantiaca]|uniref:ATP-binding cassette domain-containing protein n=1 Tax=Nocardia aurantiaca TaxID=2675850 RepID=A0A6I3LBL8_9NOCA|nr:ABC transporter ATP-binding protein [Nocardia aurantiaca]MTE17279.1 ATP-binding cassette domain-containing protein [Nocardia aurantiaca]